MSSPEYELRERIDAVSDVTAGEDDLLTIAVPPDRSVGATLERVEEAHADAEYLHADETSSARRAALERARHLLHDYDETPENGLVLFVGKPGDGDDVRAFVFDDLPAPIDAETFEWSNEFDVEAVESAARPEATYGLIVIERGGAALGRLSGETVETIEAIDSDVMGKTKAGGQSADRFERDRERQKEEFFDEVGAEAKRAFLDGDSAAVDGLLLGGTTITVEEFTDGDYLDHRLSDLVVGGTFSVEYASEQGLHQLVERGRAAMDDAKRESVRAALKRFREGLRDEAGPEVVYGEDSVAEALEYGAVETTLVSGDRPAEDVREYEERTEQEGGETVVVPATTEDGARFDETFGVAAICRFPVE